jgi:hypothetical protein
MTTSSVTLEHQAEAARADLSSTLEDLRGNMTRAALASGAATLAKEGGAMVTRAAVRRASDHPLATLLIGAGIAMLLTGGRTSGGIRLHRGDGFTDAAQQASGKVADGAAEKTSNAAAGVRNAAAAANDLATTTMDKTRQVVSQGTERVIHTVHDVQDSAGNLADRLTQLAKEQPVLTAALAIAAGAALGSMLPVSETERRYLGPSGARVTRKGRAVAEHVADATAGKAGEVVVAAAEAIVPDGGAREP